MDKGVPLAVGLALAILASFWLGPAHPAEADAIPEPEAVAGDGRNVAPVDVTAVQLVSETVTLELQTLPFPLDYDPERTRLGATTTVDFLFHNPGAGTEELRVGFPLFLAGNNRGDTYPEILALRAWVNGVEVATQEQNINGSRWSIWPMRFPPGETTLRVFYHAFALAHPFWPTASVKYLLYTGSAWAGPIGQAELIVRFPYPIEAAMLAPGRTLPGFQLSEFELRWRRANFEPTQADDLIVTFVQPEAWRQVLRARQQVAAEPGALSYRALAEAYAGPIRDCDLLDPEAVYSLCSQALGQLAEAQYRKAVELAPDDLELRQEYINFVNRNAGVNLPSGSVPVLPTRAALPSPPAGSPTSVPATPAPTEVAAQPSAARSATTPAPTPVALVTRPAIAGPLASPTVAVPANTTAPIAWEAAGVFLLAFALIVGGILFLRRRPNSHSGP